MAPLLLVAERRQHVDEGDLLRRPLRPHVGRLGRLQRRRERGGIGAHVEHLRARALLGLAHLDLLARHDARDRALRIVEVAGDDRLLRADDDARGLEPALDAMRAVVALRRGIRVGVDVQRVVRAALHAGLAADAPVAVEVDDAVVARVEGARGADRHARRALAVVAAEDGEVPPRARPLAALDVLHPRAKRPDGDVVLFLARHRAGVTADAPALVDDESVTHAVQPPFMPT